MNKERSMSVRRVAAVALVAGMLIAVSAHASPWNVKDMYNGTMSAPIKMPPWTPVSLPGPGCSGIHQDLTLPYGLMPPGRGFHGNQPVSLPVVVTSATPVVFATTLTDAVTIPSNGVLLHPAMSGDCAAVRFTAPGPGTYVVSGKFYGAYTKMNNSPVSNGTGGHDGVQPIVLKNSAALTPAVNATTQSVASPFTYTVPMSVGDKLDFAVNKRSDHWADSTILELSIVQQATVFVHPVPSPKCGQMCFEIGGLVAPGAVGNSSVTLTIQPYQNGAPVGSTFPLTITSNGVTCIPAPPALGLASFDYVVTAATATVNGNPVLVQLQQPGSVPGGIIQGPNNDVLACAATDASTCCPPMSHDMLLGMWGYNGQNAGTYTQPLDINAPATLNFVNGMNAYFALVRYLCPQTVALKVEFFRAGVLSPTTLGGPVGPLPSMGPTATVLWSSSTMLAATLSGPLLPVSNLTLNTNQSSRTTVKITGVNANGQPVNCGFDATKCQEGDTFGFTPSISSKLAAGASPYTK